MRRRGERWVRRVVRSGHLLALLLAALAATATLADVIVLGPAKDNSLYSHDGDLSNGIGEYLFSGRTDNSFGLRRALIGFDVAGSIPAGSIINSVSLQLRCSMSAPASGPRVHVLRRLLADWGEAASDAGDPGGFGGSAMPGDATWTHRFWNTTTWTNPGGDYAGGFGGSASTAIDNIAFYNWSSSTMKSDVQGWLDNPAGNFGWILIGDETAIHTAKRLDSRENVLPANRPKLTVDFTPPVITSSGSVPEDSLLLSKSGASDLKLDWDASCIAGDDDYAIYIGDLFPPFDAHFPMDCSTGGPTLTFSQPSSSAYFLIVPTNGTNEGSYGRDSSGNERPVSFFPCRPLDLGTCP